MNLNIIGKLVPGEGIPCSISIEKPTSHESRSHEYDIGFSSKIFNMEFTIQLWIFLELHSLLFKGKENSVSFTSVVIVQCSASTLEKPFPLNQLSRLSGASYTEIQLESENMIKRSFLYLPTQVHLLIGGERVTYHGSKLTNFLRKQQLEVSTHKWS